MIALFAFIFGAIFGAWRAKKRGGTTLDMLQYGAGHAIGFFLVAFTVGLILDQFVF